MKFGSSGRQRTLLIVFAGLLGLTAVVTLATRLAEDTDQANQTEERPLPGPAEPLPYTIPNIPPTPGSDKLGEARVLDFTRVSDRLPHGLQTYPRWPTSDGGTYDPDLVEVNTQTDTLEIKGVVDPTRTDAVPNKDGSPNELPHFFTGTVNERKPFLYGERTVIARFPIERDAAGGIVQQHKPVLILWPVKEDGNNWYHNVEIDFAEIFDPARTKSEVNVHFGSGERRTISTSYPIDEGFHAYTVRWTPEAVHLFIDGQEITKVNAAGENVPVIDTPEAVPRTEHRLILQADQAGLRKETLLRAASPVKNVIEVRAIISRDYED
jgi:hypothetical protein